MFFVSSFTLEPWSLIHDLDKTYTCTSGKLCVQHKNSFKTVQQIKYSSCVYKLANQQQMSNHSDVRKKTEDPYHLHTYTELRYCGTTVLSHLTILLELVRNLVAHGNAREGKWRGNWRMEWVPSTLTPPPNVVYPALLKLTRTLRLPAVDWTDAPTDLNGLVRFGERQNLVSARVPSRSARAIPLLRPVRRADNLTTFMCRLSRNLGASTSWKPQGLSTPVTGLLYLLPTLLK